MITTTRSRAVFRYSVLRSERWFVTTGLHSEPLHPLVPDRPDAVHAAVQCATTPLPCSPVREDYGSDSNGSTHPAVSFVVDTGLRTNCVSERSRFCQRRPTALEISLTRSLPYAHRSKPHTDFALARNPCAYLPAVSHPLYCFCNVCSRRTRRRGDWERSRRRAHSAHRVRPLSSPMRCN